MALQVWTLVSMTGPPGGAVGFARVKSMEKMAEGQQASVSSPAAARGAGQVISSGGSTELIAPGTSAPGGHGYQSAQS